MKDVTVIGAGASGLVAACFAAQRGNRVRILERNEKSGKKIYITGKGRCNVTNDVSAEGVLENVVRNPRFLMSSVHAFPPSSLMDFLEAGGLVLKVERGNRVFPASDKASDVTKCLEGYCRRAGVEFVFGSRVQSVGKTAEGRFEVRTDAECYYSDAVVVATGGISYPATGSTGDGYSIAESFGLKTTPRRAALVGIVCDMQDIASLQGLSLRNVRVTARRGAKELGSFFGEMLFTHFGVSGPIVLSLSSLLSDIDLSSVSLYIDLKPALDEATLDRRLLRDFEKNKNKQLCHALDELLPKSLVLPVLRAAKIPAQCPVNSLQKEKRAALLSVLKAFPLVPRSLRPAEEGIVTAGGVDVKELDPKTMECKKVSGLYFCGEVIDVDAYTGGFNLQIAFSTGHAAGCAI